MLTDLLLLGLTAIWVVAFAICQNVPHGWAPMGRRIATEPSGRPPHTTDFSPASD
jgi:hypothetical protein